MPIRQLEIQAVFLAPKDAAEAPAICEESRSLIVRTAQDLLLGRVPYFSGDTHSVGSPPDWFLDPLSGSRWISGSHWSAVDEFGGADVKCVWELSRFEWAPVLAQAWRLTREQRYLDALNSWTLDWVSQNPVNSGPNWKCGQETSIRLINLLLAARMLDQDDGPTSDLIRLIEAHCARITPTLPYALAQNNNHGTSEAAALYIGGAWLAAQKISPSRRRVARRWRARGRRVLRNRVDKLIARDGSFSQYSTNYHRVLLATLSQAEYWRRRLGEPSFNADYLSRCQAAVDWMLVLTDDESGEAPNLGANDGALLFELSAAGYDDFRPCLQLASALFHGNRAFSAGVHDEPSKWLGLESKTAEARDLDKSRDFGDGGYVFIREASSWCVIRYARFRFRPSHADVLHLDLWHRGHNVLRDGGSFSYNEARWSHYFTGSEAHNTVQFDGRDQMPRIGRFLFGEWVHMNDTGPLISTNEAQSWSGSYQDGRGARHRRSVSVRDNVWTITDEIDGAEKYAVLRWRLMPIDWELGGDGCESGIASIKVHSNGGLRRLEIRAGWESLRYQSLTKLPVLEVEVDSEPRTIVTEIVLKN